MSSLLKTLAVALVLKAGSWRKHTIFLLNYMRVLACRSLETFHLGFCGTSFWPWFSPWPFARTYLPFSDSCLKVDSCVFSPALHRWPLRCPCPKVGILHLSFHFSSGRFWFTLLHYPIPLRGVTTVVTLGFPSHLRSYHLFARAWLERGEGGTAGSVPRSVATASLGLYGTRQLHKSSLAVYQQVTSLLRGVCSFIVKVSICRNKWPFLPPR